MYPLTFAFNGLIVSRTTVHLCSTVRFVDVFACITLLEDPSLLHHAYRVILCNNLNHQTVLNEPYLDDEDIVLNCGDVASQSTLYSLLICAGTFLRKLDSLLSNGRSRSLAKSG